MRIISEIKKVLGGPIIGGDEMPWSRAMMVEGNKFVFCSGHTGRDPESKQEYPEMIEDPNFTIEDKAALDACSHDIEEQTSLVWERIKKTLEEMDTSLKNIFHMTFYLTERYNWPKAFRKSREFWKEHAPELLSRGCALSLLTNIGLDHPQMLIEVEVIATVPE